jgi:hypothetical protein
MQNKTCKLLQINIQLESFFTNYERIPKLE